ncbi:MAG TPA: ATP-binding protein [Polyangiaceae bacterium]|jgi:two-component system phosphate regulon sensor histidine kinase PhoR
MTQRLSSYERRPALAPTAGQRTAAPRLGLRGRLFLLCFFCVGAALSILHLCATTLQWTGQDILIAGVTVALGAAAVLSTAGAHLLSRSMRQLRAAATAMADDLSVRIRPSGNDEVAQLGGALDKLADSLGSSLDRLAHERDRLEAILETMTEGVLVTGPDGRVVLANRSLRSMLATTGQLAGKRPIEAIRNDELAELIEHANLIGAVTGAEIDVVGVMARRVRVRVAPLTGGRSEGAVAVLSDVTDLKRLESLRRDFVANVSHELRTPIAAVRAAAETLQSGALNDPSAARDFVDIIVRHSERLHELVEDLLKLSRIEAQKLELNVVAVDVAELTDHVIDLFALSASRHSVLLAREGMDRGLSVVADRRALEQILANLVDNAIKYSPRASVKLSASNADGEVRIAVRDTGPGIGEKHLPRLFERFYRVDRGRSREVGGTGLGLSIVKHLAEAMKGRVSVESQVGRGSIFTVHLPTAEATTEPAPEPETALRNPNASIAH